jgi:hypothetical protein
MAGTGNPRRRAFLMLAAGVFFLLAATLGKQVAFAGVGVMFLALGAALLRKHRQGGDGDAPD